MVTFYEEGHKYLNDTGEQYISVTTLLSKYKAPFDAEYWSLYKALKLVFEKKGSWVQFKAKAGGWDKVVSYYKTIPNHPLNAEVLIVKQQFIDTWDESGKVAREKGTLYHDKKEQESLESGEVINGVLIPSFKETDLITFQEFTRDGVHPEVLLYNHKFKLAGKADKVIKFGRKINIRDYKTSKVIEMHSFQDTTMKHPIEHLPACNFYEYSLQLSIYAWMLEQCGYEIGNLAIEHVPDNNKLYPVNYMKKEVERLLNHYAGSKNIYVIPGQGTQNNSSFAY